MSIRVLVVDDSNFIRKRLVEILGAEDGMRVIGQATNGLDAVQMAAELRPDVITMDVDMPVLDGISAVRRIMRERPVPILMFSVATQAGARATLEALEAGAMDFLPKQLHEISGDREQAKQLLRRRVRDLAVHARFLCRESGGGHGREPAHPSPHGAASRKAHGHDGGVPPRAGDSARTAEVPHHSSCGAGSAAAVRPESGRTSVRPLTDVNLIAIAASTGGPMALQEVLMRLPQDFGAPLLLVQHMPSNFTGSFAERLNQICKIRVKEAESGDALRPGVALLAPGGCQMELIDQGGRKLVSIRPATAGETLRPSADITFASIARHMPGKVLAVVLTGMGADGRQGAAQLKAQGASVWAQSEESCVVFGMPKAVIEAHLADRVCAPDEMAAEFLRLRAWTR